MTNNDVKSVQSNHTTTDLCYMTGEEALRRFRDHSLSPVELMRAVIDRCEKVNPGVNAITNRFYEQALAQAREAETRYTSGKPARPLEGLPLAVKELHPIKGVVTTWGSKIFEGVPADYTLPAVQRLFDAGAIMHIRTTTPEFAHAGHCHSPLYGVTHNPWNTEYSSCGSSGGSAVAVAAGMTTIAEGDDGGGSIRMPCKSLVGRSTTHRSSVWPAHTKMPHRGRISILRSNAFCFLDAAAWAAAACPFFDGMGGQRSCALA